MRCFPGTHWLKIDRLMIQMTGLNARNLVKFSNIFSLSGAKNWNWDDDRRIRLITVGFQLQKIKTCIITSSSWGPGQLANQEPGNELPDYVICTPDNHKPENALAILTANLYIPNLTNLITAQVGVILKYNRSAVSLLSERYH